VLWVAAITNHTTASGTELRNLTFGDVFLDAKPKPYIHINPETAKCRNRGREVYLDATARAGLQKAMNRARELGAFRSEHYVFPFRAARNRYDVTRPPSSCWLRAAWDGLREAIGIDWITPHALRHQCLTELMEKDAPPEQMRKIAGHLSPEMTEHYTHNRLHKQAEALDSLDPIPEVL
jgi:integrase